MPKRNKQTHILVIRLSAMGDVAMTVPVLQAFIRQYPQTRITVVTKSFFTPIVAQLPDVEVFGVDTKKEFKGFLGVIKLWRLLNKKPITHVADLHDVLRSRLLSFLFRVSGVTIARINKGRTEKNQLVRALNKRFIPLKSSHERYADVFTELGFPIQNLGEVFLCKRAIQGSLDVLFDKGKKHVGIAPFAAHSAKAIAPDRMKSIIQKLIANTDIKVLLFGAGKQEEGVLNTWEAELGKQVVSVAGRVSLEKELSVISQLDLMLAMDSGNGHLAAMFGIPVITLWGVTHPNAGFTPFLQPQENQITPDLEKFPLIPTSIYGNKCPKGYDRVIDTIPIDTIVNKVLEVLS